MTTKRKDDPRILNVETLAELLGLPSWETIEELNVDYVMEAGHHAYKEAAEEARDDFSDEGGELADGPGDASAADQAAEAAGEAAREAAESEAISEIWRQWYDGVHDAAEVLLGKHGLTLEPAPYAPPHYEAKRPFEYRVRPVKGWKEAAEQIMETINGVGYFYSPDVRTFRYQSSCKSYRDLALSHLHHVKHQPEVYGDYSARQIFERAWR